MNTVIENHNTEGHDLHIRFANGDKDAFQIIANRFQTFVFNYIVHCGVANAHQDDVFQEIFINLFKATRKYDPKRPVAPWLYKIMVNTVRGFFRKNYIEQKIKNKIVASQSDNPSSVHDYVEAKETADWLKLEIQKLPPIQRQILSASMATQMKQKETADLFQMPLNTFKTHLRRARLTLAKAIGHRKKIQFNEVM